jgi:hypothetical protein
MTRVGGNATAPEQEQSGAETMVWLAMSRLDRGDLLIQRAKEERKKEEEGRARWNTQGRPPRVLINQALDSF